MVPGDDERVPGAVRDPERLVALRRAGLLDTPAEEAFDRATRLASRLLGVPVSLVSLVDVDRQFFKSQQGLPSPYAEARQTPLSHSFCQHVVASGDVLEVEDAREHPLVHDNLAIPDLGVIAYLGVPIRGPSGHVLGSFCAIAPEPRSWSDEDRAALEDLAEQLRSELLLRAALDDLADEARSRRDLLQMLAHDVRVPAGTVVSTVRTLRRVAEERPETREVLLALIEKQGDRIARLTESILARERRAAETTSVRLADLAATAVAGGTAAGRVAVLADDATVDVDVAAVEQILSNLVGNALAHTDGGVRVTLRAVNAGVRMEVADEGPGIDRDRLAHLFRPFERGDTRAAGHGLGLHIVATLVDRLGGELGFSSSPGGGTTVDVLVPAGATTVRGGGVGG